MLCLYRNTVNLADLWQSHKKGLFRTKLTQSNFLKGIPVGEVKRRSPEQEEFREQEIKNLKFFLEALWTVFFSSSFILLAITVGSGVV